MTCPGFEKVILDTPLGKIRVETRSGNLLKVLCSP